MNTIGHEWLTYLGKESATEEVKVMCLCALYSALRNAETMDSVFHDCLDTSSKDVQLLLNTFPQVQSPGLWLECVGVSDGDEELDNFLRDKGYREKAYSNGYALLKTGESFPPTLTVYCGQDIRQLRNTLADGENLLDSAQLALLGRTCWIIQCIRFSSTRLAVQIAPVLSRYLQTVFLQVSG